ncbi:hypothetical protein SGM_0072 [Streptomyces griseoaurantiacus M045]|uniref:Uncharacterized protein n=1 Tax=Streptomyces griseoaurantiacus M045 TaxID=996637 RepID=F3N9N8_9ACTN|nr:hypothetical protein SGM_0072 [Streptomyces griseoaurantiacus M045]
MGPRPTRGPPRYEAGRCDCRRYGGPRPLSQVFADAEDLTDPA